MYFDLLGVKFVWLILVIKIVFELYLFIKVIELGVISIE